MKLGAYCGMPNWYIFIPYRELSWIWPTRCTNRLCIIMIVAKLGWPRCSWELPNPFANGPHPKMFHSVLACISNIVVIAATIVYIKEKTLFITGETWMYTSRLYKRKLLSWHGSYVLKPSAVINEVFEIY